MRYFEDRYHLDIELTEKQCKIPADQQARMQREINLVGAAVQEFPRSSLKLTVIHHEPNDNYHVEAELKVPGETIQTDDWAEAIDPAFQRTIRKLLDKVNAYKANPNRQAEEIASYRESLDRKLAAPQDPSDGALGEAIEQRDYQKFRRQLSLAGYEDWLRLRVGRWIQRYPAADAMVGTRLRIGDVLEEVMLSAFERYPERPMTKPLHAWLDDLIDPALREFLRNPDEGAQAASFARTLSETQLPTA